jgi:hypothetical protein
MIVTLMTRMIAVVVTCWILVLATGCAAVVTFLSFTD